MTAYQYIILFTTLFLSSTTAFQFRQCSGGDCPVIFPDPGLPPICYWAVDVVLDPSLSSSPSPLTLVQTTFNDSTMSISTQVHAESQLNLDTLPYESDIQVNISAPTCSVVAIDVSAKEKDSVESNYRSIGNLTWAGLAELLPSTEAGILCEADSDDCQIDLDTSVLNGSPIKIESNSIVRSGNSFYVAYNHTLFKACGGWILISNLKLTCSQGSGSSSIASSEGSSVNPPKAFCRFIFGKECNGGSSSSQSASSESVSSESVSSESVSSESISSESISSDHSSSQSDASDSSSSGSTAVGSYEMPPLPETTVFPTEPSMSASAAVVSPSSEKASIPVGGIFLGAPVQHVSAVSATSSPSPASVVVPVLVASSSSMMSSWIAQLW